MASSNISNQAAGKSKRQQRTVVSGCGQDDAAQLEVLDNGVLPRELLVEDGMEDQPDLLPVLIVLGRREALWMAVDMSAPRLKRGLALPTGLVFLMAASAWRW